MAPQTIVAPAPDRQAVANARLRAGLCPECGCQVHQYRIPVPGDPGDVDSAADCLNPACGWGY